MDNTSKTLAQINSYIGSLEHKEKEQQLKNVTWTTSLVAAVFLAALLILYAPFGNSAQSDQAISESTNSSDEMSVDPASNLVIDTLVVTEKPELASIGSVPTEVSSKKAQILADATHTNRQRGRKTHAKEKLLSKNVSSLSSDSEEKLTSSKRDIPMQGVMRSAEPTGKQEKILESTLSTPTWEPDIEPKFPGGRAALSLFIQNNVSYPKIAPKARKEGTVYVRFVVDEWGTITNAKVIKGLDESYDQEALNLIDKMPRWVPGKIQGRAVPTYKDLGIMYKMY